MSPRPWVIAAQAAAVALLVAIVYVTLLREDSGTPLPEIQAPGSEQQAQGPDGDARRDKDGQGDRGGASGGVGDTSPAFRGPFPPADQYVDAVSGLLSKVRSAPGAPPAADR